MEILLWLLVIAAVVGTVVLGRLFKISDQEAKMTKLILELIDYTNRSLPEWRYSSNLSSVCEYAIEAMEIVEATNDIEDITQLRKLIMTKAEEICAARNITIDPDFVRLLSTIVDALIVKKS